jgi:hypothetical protein
MASRLWKLPTPTAPHPLQVYIFLFLSSLSPFSAIFFPESSASSSYPSLPPLQPVFILSCLSAHILSCLPQILSFPFSSVSSSNSFVFICSHLLFFIFSSALSSCPFLSNPNQTFILFCLTCVQLSSFLFHICMQLLTFFRPLLCITSTIYILAFQYHIQYIYLIFSCL